MKGARRKKEEKTKKGEKRKRGNAKFEAPREKKGRKNHYYLL